MKILLLLLPFLIIHTSHSQSKIYPVKPITESGMHTFAYEPEGSISIPEDSWVNYFFKNGNKYSVPLKHTDDHYEFILSVPDSTQALIISINDDKQEILDSNNSRGYPIFYSTDKSKTDDDSIMEYLELKPVANFLLNLNMSPSDLVKEYDSIYNIRPTLKTGENYKYYHFLLFQADEEKSIPIISAYAKKLSNKKDEKSLMTAHQMYQMIRQGEKATAIEAKLAKNYKDGEFARQKYLTAYFSYPFNTEESMLKAIDAYSSRFKDYSNKSKDVFYYSMMPQFLEDKDTIRIEKYDKLISDRPVLAGIYNNMAWKLSGEALDNSGDDLEYAAYLSLKSLNIIKVLQTNPDYVNNPIDIQGSYNNYSDTYALILYKLKRYEEAFNYEHPLAVQDKLDTGGKERYASFAEKAKGLEFAKNYIIEQLENGTDSELMFKQLERILEALNQPKVELIRLKSLKKGFPDKPAIRD